jgi:hypothetical protein
MKVVLLGCDTMLFGSQVPIPVHQTIWHLIPDDGNAMAGMYVQNATKLAVVSQKCYREEGHTIQI